MKLVIQGQNVCDEEKNYYQIEDDYVEELPSVEIHSKLICSNYIASQVSH